MRSLILFVTLTIFSSISIAENATLTSKQIYKSQSGICGYVNKKWKPVKKVSGKTYKIISGSTALKAVCKALLVSKKINLSSLPDASGLVAASVSTTHAGVNSVSGTPPTLSEIATNGASNIFWRSGVVSTISSGSPTADQCSEFFSGTSEGQSAGFAGCYMAQETGYIMSNIIQSGNTLCYMKNFPTAEVQSAGGFSIVDGSLPSGGITKLFTPPTGNTPRFVKINISSERGTQSGILKIYSENQNSTNGDQYRYDMVFCSDENSTAREFEKTRVTLAGEFIANNSSSFGGEGDSSGQFEGSVRAFLTKVNNEFVFNPDLGRSAVFTGVNSGFSHKSVMTLNKDEITNKVVQYQGSNTRKAYGVSHVDGTSAASLRFLEGAYKENNSQYGNFSSAVEYRDSVYVSAPSNAYAEKLSAVDLSTDSFYSSEPSLANASAPIRCNQKVDVELALNMQSDAMRGIQSQCEGGRMDEMNFCDDNALSEARSHFETACHPEAH